MSHGGGSRGAGSYYVAQAGLELGSLPQLPKFWDYSHVPLHPTALFLKKFFRRGLYSSGWPRNPNIVQVGLELRGEPSCWMKGVCQC